MTLFYYDPIFQEHRTGDHPECPERLAAVMRLLQWTGTDACCRRPAWDSISLERLARVHSLAYVEKVQKLVEAGGGWIESDTFVSPRSYDVALRAAGAVCDAVQRVVAGEERRAFCLVRPPGHHALTDRAMGFCLFNNVALGARLATAELGLDRVLILPFPSEGFGGVRGHPSHRKAAADRFRPIRLRSFDGQLPSPCCGSVVDRSCVSAARARPSGERRQAAPLAPP